MSANLSLQLFESVALALSFEFIHKMGTKKCTANDGDISGVKAYMCVLLTGEKFLYRPDL